MRYIVTIGGKTPIGYATDFWRHVQIIIQATQQSPPIVQSPVEQRAGEASPAQSLYGLQVGHDTWRDSVRLELIGD